VDSDLEENLKSFFQLDYPSYEILFSLANHEDPAYAIVKKLLESHPQVAAKLIVSPVVLGPNPKVNNMVRAYEQANNDLILISDSNIRVTSDYLKRFSKQMKNKRVGMITAVILGYQAKGIGGQLEAIFLNTFYTRWMRVLFFVGRPCVVGKSMMFRRSVARRFGGMNVLARYLAEDYMAGEAIRRLGLKVVLAEEPVKQYIGNLKLSDFWARHIRWGRIRKSQVFLAFLAEPFLGSVLSGVLGAISFYSLTNMSIILFFVFHMLFWFLLDLPLLLKSENPKISTLVWGWFLREFLALPLWLNIAVGNSVNWRGRKLFLQPGGLLATEV
jgi:ceramide glucosyltransferase